MLNDSLFDLSGKKALVTGGAMGIGRSSALALASSGADVAIVDVNRERGNEVVASIKEMGRDSIFVHCDVSVSRQVQAMVDAIAHRFGRVDIAVNNAGIFLPGSDETQSEHEWDQVIGVNLTGTWLCARAEMRQMIHQSPAGGKLINIASIGAFVSTGNGAYDASKAGVLHLTRTLAAQWGAYNINVNCVSPGYVIGGMGAKSRSLEERRRLRELTPLGHVLRLEDLCGPILFLASHASDYVTGQNLVVDGGHTLGSWVNALQRKLPPRVDTAAEVVEMKKDLAAAGIRHDDDGIILD